MSELATIPAGPADPNLPPINLPQVDTSQPRQPLRITVGAKPPPPSTDPYAGLEEYQPAEAKAAEADPYAGLQEYDPQKPAKEKPPKPYANWGEALASTWPAQAAKAAWRAINLPGEVAGLQPTTESILPKQVPGLDPLSEEGLARTREMAMFVNPLPAASRAGEGFFGSIQRARSLGLGKTAEQLAAEQAAETARQAARTSGQVAAETAQQLGTPLPKGLVSDQSWLQNLTAKAQSVPLVGQLITRRAGLAVKAAKGKIDDIVEDLTPEASRAAGNVKVTQGLEDIVAANRKSMNEDYGDLRDVINPDQLQPMPALKRAVDAIKQQREKSGARGPKIDEGLDEVQTLADRGGGFEGAHLRREKLDEKAQWGTQPSLNAEEARTLRGAIKQDLRTSIVPRSAHTGTPQQAQSLFDLAEFSASRRIAQNEALQKLADAKGSGTIETLLGSAKAKRGNIPLLGQLRRDMAPEAFSQVSGTLLHELGRDGENFSLAKFVSGWDRLAPEAKTILFSPEHQKWIENIVGMGRHLKDVDQYTNKSGTAGALILIEGISKAAEVAFAIAMGAVEPSTMLYPAVAGAATALLPRALASPSKAAAMSAWVKAYRAMTLEGVPTPAKTGVFMAANRNLAHNLGLAKDDMLRIIQQTTHPTQTQAQPQP